MQVKLIVIEGDSRTAEIRLRIPAVIGRGRGSTLQIPQALVSRQHCEVIEQDGKLKVRDLGSLNGTLVDGVKITETELLPGQTLSVGAVSFRVEYQLASPSKPEEDDPFVDFGEPLKGPHASSPTTEKNLGAKIESGKAPVVSPAATASGSSGDNSTLGPPSDLPPAALPPVAAPVATPVPPTAVPVAVPTSPAASKPAPAAADDDDEDLRAFLQSLGK